MNIYHIVAMVALAATIVGLLQGGRGPVTLAMSLCAPRAGHVACFLESRLGMPVLLAGAAFARPVPSRVLALVLAILLVAMVTVEGVRARRLCPQLTAFALAFGLTTVGQPATGFIGLSAWFMFVPQYDAALCQAINARCRTMGGEGAVVLNCAHDTAFVWECGVTALALLLLATPDNLTELPIPWLCLLGIAAILVTVLGRRVSFRKVTGSETDGEIGERGIAGRLASRTFGSQP
jgi:hypothetical protein